MKLAADTGLWVLGPDVEEPPAVAVLEVSGAVLAWTLTGAATDFRLTFIDVRATDWLWRLVGEAGHVRLAAAVEAADGVELTEVTFAPEPLAALRRLAIGHWLRRWWPASARDGIGALDPALLDAEVALQAADLDGYFSQDTLDSDVAVLLAPHRSALGAALAGGDPRVAELVGRCIALADDVDLGDWSEILVHQKESAQPRRDDYALAAGRAGDGGGEVIARGVGSVHWTAVPPQVFDAAERTVDWLVRMGDRAVVAEVGVATTGSADGVPVRLEAGMVSGRGVLDRNGRSTLVLGAAEPMTETQAWSHDWTQAAVTVGADGRESAEVRDRIRRFARSRLTDPGPDAYLAEILAAEADY